MGSSEAGLEILLRAILDAKGFEDLKAQLKQSEAAHKSAAGGSNEFKDALSNVASQAVATIASYVAIGTAIAFIKSTITEAVKESRSLYQFDEVNRRLGDSTEALVAKNREWLHSMEDASGISRNELIPAYAKLSEITTTTAATQGLMQIAAGAAAHQMGEVGQIAMQLGRYLLTGAIRPAGEFGLLLKRLHSQFGDTGKELEYLAKRFGDAGASVDSTAMQIERMKVANERAKAALGETAATLMAQLGPALRAGMIAIALVEAGVIKLVGAFKSMGSTLGGLDDMMGKFFHGKFKDGITAWKQGWAEGDAALKKSNDAASDVINKVFDAEERSNAGLKIMRDKQLADIMAGLEKRKTATGDVIADIQNKYKMLIDQVKIDGGTEEEITLRTIDLLEKEAVEVGKLQLKHGKADAARMDLMLKIVELRRKLSDDETKEIELRDAQRAKEEKKELDEAQKVYFKKLQLKEDEAKFAGKTDAAYLASVIQIYKADLASFTLTVKEREEVEEKLAKAEIDLVTKTREQKYKILLTGEKQMQKMDQDELKRWKEKLEAELEMEKLTDEQIMAIRQKMNEITQKLADNEVAYRQRTEVALMGLATAAFGQNKELAIAQAIINVAEGATAIMSEAGTPYYLKIIEIAAEIAAGAAQISAIESANPGGSSTAPASGFDDPGNDYAAYIGGQKWAGDMVDKWGGGASSGFNSRIAEGGIGRSSISNVTNRSGDQQFHITFNGIMSADRVALTKFAKEHLTPMLNRFDQRRNLS